MPRQTLVLAVFLTVSLLVSGLAAQPANAGLRFSDPAAAVVVAAGAPQVQPAPTRRGLHSSRYLR